MSENKNNVLESIKKNSKKAGEWIKKGGKAVAEKASDVAVWAEEAKEKVAIIADETAETGKKIVENIKQAKQESDYRIYRPVFIDDIQEDSFNMPKMINICEMDEKRKKSSVCINSIGFQSTPNDIDVLNIFKEFFDKFGVVAYPDVSEGVYYVNPSIPGTYISVEKYYKTIIDEKVRELVRVANDLGAKRVIVEISEKEADAGKKAGKAGIKTGKGKVEATAEETQKHMVGVTVAANEKWSGHNSPKRPELVYFKNENHIHDLIEMRFDPMNKLESHTYEIEYTSSAYIKKKEAIKIDGALKAMKCNMSESMESGAEKSERTYFKYTVEFPSQQENV